MSFNLLKKVTQNKRVMFAFLYGFLALVVMYVMTSGGMGLSVDSEKYLITAEHFKQGEAEEGFKTVFPVFPMFYPLAITTFQFLGSDEEVGAARTISILSFVISVLVVFFLGLQIQGNPTAHLSALSFVIFAPLVYTFSYCWSETLYIMLSLLFLFMLTLFLKTPEGKDTRYLVGIAIFAGLGSITRYIGFSLVGTGFVVAFFLSKHYRMSKRVKQMIIFCAVASLPIVINFLMQFLYLGSVSLERAPSKLSFSQQIIHFFVTIYHDFLSFDLTFQKYVFFFTDIDAGNKFNWFLFWFNVIVLLYLLVFTVFFIKLVFSSESFRRLLRPQIGLIVYVTLYGIFLISITSSICVDPMSSRFTTPLYPFILLLVFSNIFLVLRSFPQRKLRWLLFGAVILGTILFWGIQCLSTASIYTGISSGSFPAMEHPGNRNRASLRFLQRNLDANDIIITNIPQKLTFVWPRDMPYWGFTGLDQISNGMLGKSSLPSIYVLLCTEDRDLDQLLITVKDPLLITDEDGNSRYYHTFPFHFAPSIEQNRILENALKRRELSSRKFVFENDYIYNLKPIKKIQTP